MGKKVVNFINNKIVGKMAKYHLFLKYVAKCSYSQNIQ